MRIKIISLSMLSMLFVASCTNDVENLSNTINQDESLTEVAYATNTPKEMQVVKIQRKSKEVVIVKKQFKPKRA